MIVDFAGKVVGFSGGGEGINKEYLAFQLEDSILVNSVEDWVPFRDIGLLPIPRCCSVSFSSRGLVL